MGRSVCMTGTCPLQVAHLSVELDSQDGVGVTVVADLCPLLEVVDVHALRHGGAHHDYQTAGEQTLHDVDIWGLCWGRAGSDGDPRFNLHFSVLSLIDCL